MVTVFISILNLDSRCRVFNNERIIKIGHRYMYPRDGEDRFFYVCFNKTREKMVSANFLLQVKIKKIPICPV